MKSAMFLAWKSLWWHRGRSVTIMIALAIMIWLPVTVRLALNEFRSEITARADATPLIAGSKGSRIDLVLHALYFDSVATGETTMDLVREVSDVGPVVAIPLHIRHRSENIAGSSGAPIVGTSPEYFEFRRLEIDQGDMMAMLGECVVGANVAESMNLKPGDSVMSANRNTLDLAGDYPLKMKVTGVLKRTCSADDGAVFTDVRTAWVIDGIGHGHQNVSRNTDPALTLPSDDPSVVQANAGVLPYTEITEDNLDSFHFHGDPENFPLTAVVIVPKDEKSRVLTLGRFASRADTSQCLSPSDVIAELLQIVFRIEQLVWACSVAAAMVTLLLLWLILTLSLKLRAAEMLTMFRMGCSRGTIASLQVSELVLLLVGAVFMAAGASILTASMASRWIRELLF
ncbi:MAG: ABC transporter permease [Planctomycetota bacterium]